MERTEREGEKNEGFLRRFTRFCLLEFVGPRTKVHRLDEGYTWVSKMMDFTEDPLRGFGEIKGFEFRKCFKASYGFYDAPRGRDSSYFDFIPTFGLN